jgi:subtilisin-like proprotein convertase family protein
MPTGRHSLVSSAPHARLQPRAGAVGGGSALLESLESRRLFAIATFTSDVTLTLPGEGSGDFSGSPASAYPSTIDVSGMDGSISKVTITLNNLSHAFPGDLDVLLVSPGGRSVMLMSDNGDEPSEDLTLTFSDDAVESLPAFGQLVSGEYRPTNVNLDDEFPPPVVNDDSWSGLLATFNGTLPNGTWKLYVSDDAPGDAGTLGGWNITITSDLTVPVISTAAFRYEVGPQELRFHLDKSVAPTLSLDNIVIQNADTGETIPNTCFTFDYDVRSNTAELTVVDPAGALPDGNYRAVIHAENVHDEAGVGLDGDADGISGGDYVLDFFFLAGDANHDRVVDTLDFNALAANFGRSNAQYPDGDFTYDGVVDTLDFNVLAAQFGKHLDPPPPGDPSPPPPSDPPGGSAGAEAATFSTTAIGTTRQQQPTETDPTDSLAADVLA